MCNKRQDVGRLLVGQFGQHGADLLQVQARHLLVQVLGQHVDLAAVSYTHLRAGGIAATVNSANIRVRTERLVRRIVGRSGLRRDML